MHKQSSPEPELTLEQQAAFAKLCDFATGKVPSASLADFQGAFAQLRQLNLDQLQALSLLHAKKTTIRLPLALVVDRLAALDIPTKEFSSEQGNTPIYSGANKPTHYVNSDQATEPPVVTVSRVGNAGEVNYISERALFRNAGVYKGKEGVMSTEFLYLSLKSLEPSFKQMATGKNIRSLRLSQLQEVQLVVPSLEEQERIVKASLLRDLDAEDKVLQRQQAQLAKLKTALYHYLSAESTALDRKRLVESQKASLAELQALFTKDNQQQTSVNQAPASQQPYTLSPSPAPFLSADLATLELLDQASQQVHQGAPLEGKFASLVNLLAKEHGFVEVELGTVATVGRAGNFNYSRQLLDAPEPDTLPVYGANATLTGWIKKTPEVLANVTHASPDAPLVVVSLVQNAKFSLLTEPAIVSRAFLVSPAKDLVTPRYLYQALQANAYRLDKCYVGEKVMHLDKRLLERTPVLLAPLQEQDRLAGVFDSIDSLLAQLEQSIQLLQELSESSLSLIGTAIGTTTVPAAPL